MRTLIVFAHPSAESYGAALLETARRTLDAQGHDLRVIDLYRQGFDPVLSEEDWNRYATQPEQLVAQLQDHVDAMLWAESLLLIYPTWMYGPPAMLKGWLERVWLPGVAFGIPSGKGKRATGNLRNIRQFTVVTTSGSPWWWLRLIRDPNRSLMMRGFRVLFHRNCRTSWLQLHSMNHRTETDRQKFLGRVERKLARI
ncbi:NAD(P)H-dependent oxidoreductase [Mameliella sediminis]|uniref:NAD(P)H-dependent oxidoreductase n=1 Tax=Mameliella sediminis TaxID=2836866 RepID=UPI001C484A42|nr:NAD(P)H-dependent oxidoreductase [Mameliella sediminis]MBV7396573.1 NAD(P)H-dependent oxidoreductase [Mameliella sediminis]MBY6117163.1 NAD(P)H-dependent oxidoreductase [Antarctobacter heliothermus]MBY6147019.1 NAD(P)H-dependent oxidoreductase [Mameliella alba]MCA0957024.1 NAD(P)H-dependent oxidoreductase [Mameliella alba]